MRTITQRQLELIEDLSAQGLLRNLPVQTAEKDIHVTDLLARLAILNVEHAHFKGLRKGEVAKDTGIKLVFAGGTCLSKAYGLIERMSEDIDIKVVLSDPDNLLKADAGERSRLKALHGKVLSELSALSLLLTQEEGYDNPKYRDSHRYFVAESKYGSRYSYLPSLRPTLKLEIIHRPPRLPTVVRSIGYLHELLAGIPLTQTTEIECISVAETLAEKVLSLLRRCAWKWSGHQRTELDPTLTRHIYDVHRIMQVCPGELSRAQHIFPDLVTADQYEFAKQNPEFDADPKAVLQRTLISVSTSSELQTLYANKVLPLVYGGQVVSFQDSFTSFQHAAEVLLAQL